jgi:phenylalanyl-tRNA synthetase beta chain
MRTESSARYEKGLDPENCYAGLERACELVELLGAGDVVNEIIDVYPGKKPLTVLDFNPVTINKFLGTDIPADEMIKILETLECKVNGNKITVRTFHMDKLPLAILLFDTSDRLTERLGSFRGDIRHGYTCVPFYNI